MKPLYNLATKIAEKALPLAGRFNHKLKLFTEGRKSVFDKLQAEIDPAEDYLWFHAASLGEFEQALPIIEEVKKEFPKYKVLITFFSPSGYENKKNHPLADVITYLPLDTANNAKRFLALVKPKIAFFIKYEIWPNFLTELKKQNIKILLVSGAFRENQVYFKPYGGFMRKALSNFDHFFVQNETSAELIKSIGFNNITQSGDTRFDRVSRQIQYNNTLDFAEEFINNKTCLVAGSTWPEDEEILLPFINQTSAGIKIIIAPHEIKEEKIKALEQKIKRKSIRYSAKENQELANFEVLILDTIGLLGKVYSYANIAYVGGAAGTSGLHNILEPATFGIPVIIGKNYNNFPEAIRLRQLAGLFSVETSSEFSEVIEKLLANKEYREKTGMIAGHFINSNTGATQTIINYLKRLPGFS
ncbi:3-deoxy-D-manno-octulosonic acid transferase [Salegentibacter salinarum]|uniref:3-deoxy-D-manno-octulosonic acid transferase n=1 Tax=Salegentibacter salinarum TaxID=447422 RepID=A0A2N0TMA1_9FLAO|nr:glycosyltransferase N-terminal domain-containing protein [Salegentibacter salinarum]PKD15856.1 3-deoxy-D-manno-octulosonic acid transferase [Salegentibacter salinarum]SKB72797.1 3-deoxy-D-manno-octulosonic-acid transferase [Salegentibacter salinarum]